MAEVGGGQELPHPNRLVIPLLVLAAVAVAVWRSVAG